MEVAIIVAELRNERKRLDEAIAALEGINGTGPRLRGNGRTMSASARRRIAAAQKKRWAKWKKENKRA